MCSLYTKVENVNFMPKERRHRKTNSKEKGQKGLLDLVILRGQYILSAPKLTKT